MTKEELEHRLAILVELQLFPVVRAVKESNVKDKDLEIKGMINKFIEGLPEYLSEIPNLEELVYNVLKRTGRNNEEMKKIRRANDLER